MENKVFCEFGKQIKKKLVDINQTQNWLIEETKQDTQLFFDRSYLYKIMTGQLATPRIVSSICKILNIERPL